MTSNDQLLSYLKDDEKWLPIKNYLRHIFFDKKGDFPNEYLYEITEITRPFPYETLHSTKLQDKRADGDLIRSDISQAKIKIQNEVLNKIKLDAIKFIETYWNEDLHIYDTKGKKTGGRAKFYELIHNEENYVKKLCELCGIQLIYHFWKVTQNILCKNYGNVNDIEDITSNIMMNFFELRLKAVFNNNDKPIFKIETYGDNFRIFLVYMNLKNSNSDSSLFSLWLNALNKFRKGANPSQSSNADTIITKRIPTLDEYSIDDKFKDFDIKTITKDIKYLKLDLKVETEKVDHKLLEKYYIPRDVRIYELYSIEEFPLETVLTTINAEFVISITESTIKEKDAEMNLFLRLKSYKELGYPLDKMERIEKKQPARIIEILNRRPIKNN